PRRFRGFHRSARSLRARLLSVFRAIHGNGKWRDDGPHQREDHGVVRGSESGARGIPIASLKWTRRVGFARSPRSRFGGQVRATGGGGEPRKCALGETSAASGNCSSCCCAGAAEI